MDASFFKLRMVPGGVKGNNEISSREIDFRRGSQKPDFIHTRGGNLIIVQDGFDEGLGACMAWRRRRILFIEVSDVMASLERGPTRR
jgi:hypothetical protein